MRKQVSEADYSGSVQKRENAQRHCGDADVNEPPLEPTGLKRQGWALIVGGLVVIGVTVLAPHHLLYWFYLPIGIGMASLAIAAGLKLIMRKG